MNVGVAALVLVLAACAASRADPLLGARGAAPAEDSDSCFCGVNGQIEDCCCDVETVDTLNRKIFPIVSELVGSEFFRYYKVNMNKGCPFWKDGDFVCMTRECALRQCEENEVPRPLDDTVNNVVDGQCVVLSRLDQTMSESELHALSSAGANGGDDGSFCDPSDENDPNAEWSNLLRNPERYTGYVGDASHRIWKSIYNENCFVPEDGATRGAFGYGLQSISGMCVEKRAFYRVLSGLHASITTHLCGEYLDRKTGTWVANFEEFDRRFSPPATGGEGPLRLKNLYFTYLVVLRAVVKAADVWEAYPFFTGNPDSDYRVRSGVRRLLKEAQACPGTFDESIMFTGRDAEEARQLKEEFRSKFRNVSRIMDCVGCDKCRHWGKLQVHGLATALKILFASEERNASSPAARTQASSQSSADENASWTARDTNGQKARAAEEEKRRFRKGLNLRRNDVVALFNVLERLSKSIELLEMFRHMQRSRTSSADSYVPSGIRLPYLRRDEL